jgi:head-tail adaptor
MIARNYIEIQRSVATIGVTGGSTTQWLTYWAGFANIEEKAYNVGTEAGQWEGLKPIVVKLRKNAITESIRESMRVVYRNRFYLIKDISEMDAFYLKLSAVERKLIQE